MPIDGTQMLHRLLHALPMRARVDGQTGRVVHAESDHRPAIVLARLDAIQLVAALRPVLVGPQIAGLRMNRQALHVAMAVAPDFRPRAGAGHERIVRRHAAVVVQADDLAVMVGEVLRRMRFEVAFRRHLPIAERQEQEAVLVERDLAAVVVPALRDGVEDLLTCVSRSFSKRPRMSAVLESASVAPGFE